MGRIIEVHSVQSTVMREITTCGWIIEVHSVQSTKGDEGDNPIIMN